MRHIVFLSLLTSVSLPVTAQGTVVIPSSELAASHESTSIDHSTMQHSTPNNGSNLALVSEPGQSAFAAIAEIVTILQADPETDWDSVNIDGLREHLRDMDIVTIDAQATHQDIENGVLFTITGDENVAPSIKRMAMAHAGIMQGVNNWSYDAHEIDNGATIAVTVPEQDLAQLKALGFFGLMASGMHHQTHHWMMATGTSPHA